MMKSRFTEEQIVGFLKHAEAGLAVTESCRKGGFLRCDVLQVPSQARAAGAQPGGVPAEKHCLIGGIVTVQLLAAVHDRGGSRRGARKPYASGEPILNRGQ